MHKRSLVVVLSLTAAAAAACASAPSSSVATAASPLPTGSLEARRAALRDVINDQWEWTMRSFPTYASYLGDRRYNDRWIDNSEAAIAQRFEDEAAFQKRLLAIDTTSFSEQEIVNKELLVRDMTLDLAARHLESWLMPVSQLDGLYNHAPHDPSNWKWETVRDYDDYIARLRSLPTAMDQEIALMRAGMVKGLIPPKILLEKVAPQALEVVAVPAEQSPFMTPLKTFPAAVSAAEQGRIRAAVVAAIKAGVEPSYRRFASFVEKEYAPRGRIEIGLSALPLGEERYKHAIVQETTTSLSADEIHAIGLREVTRIRGRMVEVAKKLGFADLASFSASTQKNEALHFHSREHILELYRKYASAMQDKLPALFGRLPKAKLQVHPVEEFREHGAPFAEYDVGLPDGSRPGVVLVNTQSYADRLWLTVETTTLHEGVPGHHLQCSIASELTDVPRFRTQYQVGAYTEGWALYAEKLGEEVGFYQDPYSYYGHLQEELLRAIRLVADTGLHSKHWSRQQVIAFFHANSTMDEVELQQETDRYIAWPGQGLAYKIGELKILELRAKAEKALGAKFDVRRFHDTLLEQGALPLDLLEAHVDRWIDSQKAK